VFTRILTGSAVLAFFAVAIVTVAAVQERDGPPTAVLATRSLQPTPTAAPTVSAPQQPGPFPRRAGSRPGYDRIDSVEGGWSMEIPEKWVADVGNLRGAEIASFDMQRTDFSGNAPASDQLRMRVSLMPEYDHLSLEALGAKGGVSAAGPIIGQSRTTVAGQAAVQTLMRSSSPSPRFDLLHVYWHFRSPFFADRVVIVDAWPADGTLRAVADQAVATFQLSQPKATTAAPLSRQQAIDRATAYLRTTGRVDRVAAKLVGFHEYEVASNSGRSYTQDPDDLVWVVVTTGEFPSTHSRPPSAAPPLPDRLIVQAIGSSSGGYFSGMYSDADTWPAWFDGLKDRAP